MHNEDPVAADEPRGQLVQIKLLPDPDEAYSGKQEHDQAPEVGEAPDGQASHAPVMKL